MRRCSGRAFLWVQVSVLFALSIRPVYTRSQDSSYTTDGRVGQLYLQAQEAQRSGDYRDAAEKYSAILKLQPDGLETRVNLGLMHHLLGEYAEAIGDFEIVLREKPALFVPNLFLGIDFIQLHQPRRALPYLECAQGLQPQDVEPVLQLARAYAGGPCRWSDRSRISRRPRPAPEPRRPREREY